MVAVEAEAQIHPVSTRHVPVAFFWEYGGRYAPGELHFREAGALRPGDKINGEVTMVSGLNARPFPRREHASADRVRTPTLQAPRVSLVPAGQGAGHGHLGKEIPRTGRNSDLTVSRTRDFGA